MIYRKSFILDALLVLFLLILYTSSMPLSVCLEDDGAFILSSYFSGIAHPPGYPLYTFLGSIVSHIEISTVAARLHAMSGVFGVVACFFVCRITYILTDSRYVGLISGLIYGLSETVWAQSIIAEVYTLNSAIFFSIFYCLLLVETNCENSSGDLKSFDDRKITFLLCLAGFLFGLGLSNHWPLLLLSFPALVIMVINQWRYIINKLILIWVFFVIGLLPYLWMYVKGLDPEAWITFGGWQNFREFSFYVMREGYSSVDSSVTADFSDKLFFAKYSVLESVRQFGAAACIVAMIGVYTLIRDKCKLTVAIGMVGAFFGNSVILSFLLGFDFDEYRKIVFSVYLLVPFGIVSIFISVAISRFFAYVTSSRIRVLVHVLVMVYPCTTLAKNIPNLYRRDDTWGHDYAMWVLTSLPENSVLFVNDDTDTGPVGYLHYVEGIRNDITLYQSIGALYPNRLFHPYKVNKKRREDLIVRFIESSSEPIFSTSRLSIPLEPTPLGALYRYGTKEQLAYEGYYSDINIELVLDLLSRAPKTGWQIVHREFLSQLILYTMLIHQDINDISEDVLGVLLETFDAKLYLLKWLLVQEKVDVAMAGRLVSALEQSKEKAYSKASLAEFYFTSGLFHLGLGNRDIGISSLERSVDIVPTVANGASEALLEEYIEDDNFQGIKSLELKINHKFSKRETSTSEGV